ncbi:hypothetical protein BUALT_Bualt04G0094100 [Buddleja alternifolia]|uniref:Uncharacterized protein n=1 Tax=Buddleja alternifolia TaxID=168488 RepID=A0AAV6XPL6_9LAMI|nr:hypothetical protein BUALT_Bualt04G0094100 [Buddleja alternifolia]
MIETNSDEHWEAACKTEPNARVMRYKSWPCYDLWYDIFGKDRGNGGFNVKEIEDWTSHEKIVATNMIFKNMQVLAMFFSLPDHAKVG